MSSTSLIMLFSHPMLDDETDLTMPNDNLIVDIDDEYYDARLLDTGERRTQCIIAEKLWVCCKTN